MASAQPAADTLPLPSTPTEDLHHFDTPSWRLLSAVIGDEGLRRSVLFVITYR